LEVCVLVNVITQQRVRLEMGCLLLAHFAFSNAYEFSVWQLVQSFV
jgi:hypothetical protein